MLAAARRFRFFLLACLVLSAVLAPGRPGAGETDYRTQIHDGVNALRQKQGLAALRPRADLQRIAQRYAVELAGRGLLSHYDAQGKALDARLHDAGCDDWTQAGENLARSTFSRDFQAADIVRGWNLSSGHYRNIITPGFRFTGIGVAFDARREQIYFVQIFVE